MSSDLFTCKSCFSHDLNMTVLNVLEIAFVVVVSQAGPRFPMSLSFKWTCSVLYTKGPFL